jgi:hypothetical protein
MNEPTPEHVALAFWRFAVGEVITEPDALRYLGQRHHEDIEAGWYQVRLAPRAPWSPVEIRIVGSIDDHGILTDDEQHVMEIAERPVSAAEMRRRWPYCQPITRSRYADLLANHRRQDRVGDLFRASHARIDLSQEPVT